MGEFKFGGINAAPRKRIAVLESTMTVNEVAGVLGVTSERIKQIIREEFPDLMKNGITTRLNEQQVVVIKNKTNQRFDLLNDINLQQNVVGENKEVSVISTQLEDNLIIAKAWSILQRNINDLTSKIKTIEEEKQQLVIKNNETQLKYDITKEQLNNLFKRFSHDGLIKPGDVAKILDVSTRSLHKHLQDNGVIWKRCGNWVACHKYKDLDYFDLAATGFKVVNKKTGRLEDRAVFTDYFTPKGLNWLVQEFLPEHPL